MSELDDLRCKIDSLDKIIAECYAQRLDVVRSIGEYKKNNNIAVLDSGREDLVYENVKNMLQAMKKKFAICINLSWIIAKISKAKNNCRNFVKI